MGGPEFPWQGSLPEDNENMVRSVGSIVKVFPAYSCPGAYVGYEFLCEDGSRYEFVTREGYGGVFVEGPDSTKMGSVLTIVGLEGKDFVPLDENGFVKKDIPFEPLLDYFVDEGVIPVEGDYLGVLTRPDIRAGENSAGFISKTRIKEVKRPAGSELMEIGPDLTV